MPRSHVGAGTSTVGLHAHGRCRADHLANRAFELYERRSSIDGWDLDDALELDAGPVQDRQQQLAAR